ncbi:phosphotransferase family [Fusarium albosuccineum]|uniref:Phosphotransferase family n=1 Tax=Fusarium albosuccineum TaxID=1237068 RepID=A0A8H4L260_9HYPO|nr:phosphotransferase family [Fusarium albosuccineum]
MKPQPGTVLFDTIPSGTTVTFQHSSFFTRNGPDAILPSPRQVLAKSAAEDPHHNRITHRPVIFESLRLFVRFGKEPQVTIAEGQCLWALRQYLPGVPVPEIYGWVEEDDQMFIYMELVEGTTLERRWDSLCRNERINVCEQLRSMIDEVRQLQQDPKNQFLGHINRGPYNDFIFTNGGSMPPAGPFLSVREFHDWLSAMIKRGIGVHWPGYAEEDIPDPYRQLLPDNSTVVFTHADLHRSNIMVTEDSSSCRIVALIDWRQSGWYPDYWEFCKAEITPEGRSEWVTEYIPRFLEEPDDATLEGFESYTRAYGC